MTYLNKKDIIRINQEIGESGQMQNESSLDFALHQLKHKKSWQLEVSYIVRSLLVDHVFQDGNKRTAFTVILTYFKDEDIDSNKDKLIKSVWMIAKNNIKDVNKIWREIKNAIIL